MVYEQFRQGQGSMETGELAELLGSGDVTITLELR